MRVHANFSALRQNRWSDYIPRFLFGGLVTVGAGLVAKHFSPVVGGLFLAFPEIFPASATLLEKREEKKKQNHGMNGSLRGKLAVALGSRGAAIGSIGLACFAVAAWKLMPHFSGAVTLSRDRAVDSYLGGDVAGGAENVKCLGALRIAQAFRALPFTAPHLRAFPTML